MADDGLTQPETEARIKATGIAILLLSIIGIIAVVGKGK